MLRETGSLCASNATPLPRAGAAMLVKVLWMCAPYPPGVHPLRRGRCVPGPQG